MATKLLLLDVDGVMTDGTKIYSPDGSVIGKRFCDHDFTAIKCFQEKGWVVVFLSADTNVNEAVAKSRGIPFFNSREPDGTIDKVKRYYEIKDKYGLDPNNAKDVVYVGDDLLDVPVMQAIVMGGGRAYFPSNAVPQFRRLQWGKKLLAQEIQKAGGAGAIMTLFDLYYHSDLVIPKH